MIRAAVSRAWAREASPCPASPISTMVHRSKPAATMRRPASSMPAASTPLRTARSTASLPLSTPR